MAAAVVAAWRPSAVRDETDEEAEARDEIASFIRVGHPAVDLPLLRSRLNRLRCNCEARGGGAVEGGGDAGRSVLFSADKQREISE